MASKSGNGTGNETQGSLQELHDLLREFDTAMLVTVTPENMLRARPMEIQDPSEMPGCDLWFVTREDTAKADEIAREAQVCVCAYRSRDKAYVSISARAQMVKDSAAVKRLWKPSWKAWFPKGPDDPSITLLELRVEHAEYWEPAGGRARVLYEIVKSMLKGGSADANLPPPKHI